MNPGDPGNQREKRKSSSYNRVVAALKKEKITPLLRAFLSLKANVTIGRVVKERSRQNICDIPFSQKQNNTQVVQNSLLSQQDIQEKTRQVMTRQVLPDGSQVYQFNGINGNSYSHRSSSGAGPKTESVLATSPLPRSGVAAQDSTGESGFRTEEGGNACLRFCGELGVARDLLISQIKEGNVGTIAFCTSINDRDVQNYKYIEKQHFTRWFGKAIDRVHDIDEHKKSQLSQSVFYQRWSAELTSIPPDKLGIYLSKINNFYTFIGTAFGDSQKEIDSAARYRNLFGSIGGQPLTFKTWWEMGHPTLMERENYDLSKTVGVNSVKNRMVDGLVLSLNRDGCGFVLPIDDTLKSGFVLAVAELKTSDEESGDSGEFNKAMDVIGHLGPAVTNVLFSHASALKSTEKTDTITYERIDALKHSHKGQMPTDFFTMDSPASKLDAGPKKKLAEEKTRKYPGDQLRRSLFALGPNGSRSYDMVTMTNGGIVAERQVCEVTSTPILPPDSFARQIDTAWIDQVKIISADLNTAIAGQESVEEQVTVACTFLTEGYDVIFMKQLTKQYQGASIPLWTELKKLDVLIKTARRGPHNDQQAARDRTLVIAKQLTKIATNEGCLNADAGQDVLLQLAKSGNGLDNFTNIVSPLVGELYKCINVLSVTINDDTIQILDASDSLVQVSASDQARLKSLIDFVTTLAQPPPPPLFLTKVHQDKEGKLYVYVHPNRYYPLGILSPELFVFTIEGEPYLPVEIINALEVCFRRKASNGVYDKLVAEDVDSKTQREIDRMAKFIQTDVAFDGSEEFTGVLTSRMMVEDRNKLSKTSIKTSRYTQRSNMLDNISGRGEERKSIVTASPEEVVNVNIAAASTKDIFIDALTNIMPIRMDETQLPDQEAENNLYTVINHAVANSFLPGRIEVYTHYQEHGPWDALEEHIQTIMRHLLEQNDDIERFLAGTRQGATVTDVNQAKKILFTSLIKQLIQHLVAIQILQQTTSEKATITILNTNFEPGAGWTTLGYSSDILVNWLNNFANKVHGKLSSITFPQLKSSDDLDVWKEEMITESKAEGVSLLSGDETQPPSKYIHDASHPIGQSDSNDPHPLLKVIIEEMDEDSHYVISITSEVHCIILDKIVSVPFDSPASVKIVRIKMFEAFETFLNILKEDEGAMDVVEEMYLNYANRLHGAGQLQPHKYDAMEFSEMWPIFLERIAATSATTAAAAKVKDDDEGDKKSSTSKDPGVNGIISPSAQIFGRHFDGISTENKYGDEAPHILKNVIKDFACQLLQLRCDGLGGPTTVMKELQEGEESLLTLVHKKTQDAAIQYILEDLAAQKGKTTGDYIQKVEVQMDNLLWSTDWQTEFNRQLHISGFGSFDRIATILAAIDDVPTICINAKGVTIGVGGINYKPTKFGNLVELKESLGPDRLVRIELMSSIRDLNWMIPAADIPEEIIPFIRTIMVLKTMWIDVGNTTAQWWQHIGNSLENLEGLDNVSDIINNLIQTILNQLGGNLEDKQGKFGAWLNNKGQQLDNIYQRDIKALNTKCTSFGKEYAQRRLEQAKLMRGNIFLLLNTYSIENNVERKGAIKTLLGKYFPTPKKGGGSRKRRRRRRRKTRRKKKRRKRKSIKKRRKRGRKTRRK